MDYVEGLNLSIAYIEDNLFGEIDYDRAARIAGISKSTYHGSAIQETDRKGLRYFYRNENPPVAGGGRQGEY